MRRFLWGSSKEQISHVQSSALPEPAHTIDFLCLFPLSFSPKLISGQGLHEQRGQQANRNQLASWAAAWLNVRRSNHSPFFSFSLNLFLLVSRIAWNWGWEGEIEERRGEEEEEGSCWGGGGRGGDRQDLIKDCLCYVISSKRRRPRCCRDGEQLAWGCLIACSDSFQASSFGAHTRNGTDVYSWVPRQRLHGNHCFYRCDPVTPLSLSQGRSIYIMFEWAQLLQRGKAPIYRANTGRTACSSLNQCVVVYHW